MEVWFHQGILGVALVADNASAIDQEHGPFCHPGMAFPRFVLDTLGPCHGTIPVRQHGKIDAERGGEGLLGERGGYCNRDRLGSPRPDLGGELSQLGQFVPSHIAEVEHVEQQESRSAGRQVLEADGFLERASQSE